MKTSEEKRKAVLDYCNEVCPKGTIDLITIDGVTLEWMDYGDVLVGGIRLYGVADWMYIEEDMSDHVANHAYKILGLGARDAVEAERGKLQALVEASQKVISESQAEYALSTMSELPCMSEGFEGALARLEDVVTEIKKGETT